MAGEATIFIPGIKGTKLLETNLPTSGTDGGIQRSILRRKPRFDHSARRDRDAGLW